MPNRYVQDAILASDSLMRVSLEAEHLFWRLIMAADDYGRLDGRPAMVLAKCFPMRRAVTEDSVRGWLLELQGCDDDGRGPVLEYLVDGRPYLQLRGWEKHRGTSKRAQHSKFPRPSGVDVESPGCPGDSRMPGESPDPLPSTSTSTSTNDEVRKTKETPAAQGAGPPAGGGQQELIKTPKRRRKPEETADGQVAIAAWCQAHLAARLTPATLLEADKGRIRAIAKAIGPPEEHMAALAVFFALDDRWVRDQGYSPEAWSKRWRKCIQASRAKAAFEAREAERRARHTPITPEQEAIFERFGM